MIKIIMSHFGFFTNKILKNKDKKNTKLIKSYKIKQNMFFIFFIMIFFTFIIIAYNFGWIYLLGLPFSLIFSNLSNKYKIKLFKKKTILKWDNFENTNNESSINNFKNIREYFDFTSNASSKQKSIDDATWDDLNMGDFYKKINRTYTNAGESILYNILRSPLFSQKELLERTEDISKILNNKTYKEELLFALKGYGKDKYKNLEFLIFDEEPPKSSKLRLLTTVLGISGFISLLLFFVLQQKALLFVLPLFIINGTIILLLKNKLDIKISSIIELRKLIIVSNKISSLFVSDKIKIELKTLNKSVKKLLRKTNKITPSIKTFLNIFYDYINILFLIEVRTFYSSLDDINKNIGNLRRMYYLVGMLDAYQAIALYTLKNEKRICTPIFIDGDISLKTQNIEHPLVIEPIGNNIDIDNPLRTKKGQGVIITGSNMSGKTTFLRTLGLNIILAQTLNICHAKKFESTFFLPISSINQHDSLKNGKSFYYSEAERILEIINKCKSDTDIVPFCIFDEILKGTNTKERLNASLGILKYLENLNVVSIVATHDIALANKIKSFDTYHFIDSVTKEGLHFDFKLKPGISNSSNALKLLEFMNYPDAVIEFANL